MPPAFTLGHLVTFYPPAVTSPPGVPDGAQYLPLTSRNSSHLSFSWLAEYRAGGFMRHTPFNPHLF